MQKFLTIGVTLAALMLGGCATGPSDDLREGWELMVAEDYAAARDHYEGVLAEYPENPYAHLNLGVAYQQLGQRDLAREHYEAAVAYGENAEITRIADEEGVSERTITVADQARQNLDTLTN